MTAPPLLPILDHLRDQPSRTWSIVVTFYGDAIVPRGGSVSLAALLAVFAAMGIGGNVVRTAMSRLAGDDWVQRTRLGRNSFYRLTEAGRATFTAAACRIYGRTAPDWDGHLRLALPEFGDRDPASRDPASRDRERAALKAAGFGMTAPGVWLAAAPAPDTGFGDTVLLDATADQATARRLAQQAWPLQRIAGSYQRFTEAFAPLGAWVGAGRTLSDGDAVVARTLLIHEYRRIVLREPGLPLPLLPADWPGAAARALTAGLYGALMVPSERWLDGNAADERGALPPADGSLASRFQG